VRVIAAVENDMATTKPHRGRHYTLWKILYIVNELLWDSIGIANDDVQLTHLIIFNARNFLSIIIIIRFVFAAAPQPTELYLLGLQSELGNDG
jgi:hypothetical protein